MTSAYPFATIVLEFQPASYPMDRLGLRSPSNGGPLKDCGLVINLDYPGILDLLREHLDPKRSESASLLIWYFENYYRLDRLEATDAVCDQKGDRGVDGIFVNESEQTITIFQARISQRSDRSVGDSALREFAGTITQFATPESLHALTASASGSGAQLASLIRRLDLASKILTHEVRGEFISNIDIDQNGKDFLKTQKNMTFVGKRDLIETYLPGARNLPEHNRAEFDILGFTATEYVVDADTKAVIAPIKAMELVQLDEIANQTLFAYNVRGPLGRTGVNKDIEKSIRDQQRHKTFPLFHNGITIVAAAVDIAATKDKLITERYYVVNGCQSLSALFDNRLVLTDDLRVLVKFIKTDPESNLAEMITQFSNNQNGVRPRDFKANNPIQIRLQREMRECYGDIYSYAIKRGERPGAGVEVSNEDAGLWFRAFDLKEPWVTHRKSEVFEDKHSDLFGRPEVTADRIVMLQVIVEAIDVAIKKIENALFGKYVLTKYLLLFIVRQILESDEKFVDLNRFPGGFVRSEADRTVFRECVSYMLEDIIVDLNGEVAEDDANFYRDKLRDQVWVKEISRKVVGDHRKLVGRGRIATFSQEWEKRKSHGH